MSLTTWMQSLWKVPPVGKLALNNLHKMKRPLKLNIWQDSCVHSAIFDYYMRRSILTLNLSKQQKVRIFLWICCSKTYRFFVFWFRFKVTFVLLVLWGEGGVLVAIVFCACWCLLSNYGCFLSPGALPIVHSSAHPAFGPPGFINPWSQCQPVFLIVDKADHCGTKYCLAPSLLQISKVPIIKGWYFCGRASRRCWSITPCDRYSPPVCPCQRWTAKWTIVPPSRSDHRVTGSHRGCLGSCTRSEALPETVRWCFSAGVHLLLAPWSRRGSGGWRKRRGCGGGGSSTGVSGRETAVGHAQRASPAEAAASQEGRQPRVNHQEGLCFP